MYHLATKGSTNNYETLLFLHCSNLAQKNEVNLKMLSFSCAHSLVILVGISSTF